MSYNQEKPLCNLVSPIRGGDVSDEDDDDAVTISDVSEDEDFEDLGVSLSSGDRSNTDLGRYDINILICLKAITDFLQRWK